MVSVIAIFENKGQVDVIPRPPDIAFAVDKSFQAAFDILARHIKLISGQGFVARDA